MSGGWMVDEMTLRYQPGGFWRYETGGLIAETMRCGPYAVDRIQVADGAGNFLRVAMTGPRDPYAAKAQIEAAIARYRAGERGDVDTIPTPAPSMHPRDVGFDPAITR